jgi:hypothetical protein
LAIRELGGSRPVSDQDAVAAEVKGVAIYAKPVVNCSDLRGLPGGEDRFGHPNGRYHLASPSGGSYRQRRLQAGREHADLWVENGNGPMGSTFS